MRVTTRKRSLFGALILMMAFPLGSLAQNIPEPPQPTPVDGSKKPAYQAPKAKTCRTVAIRAVCGTEKVCQNFPQRGIVCHEREKYCTKTTETCN